MADHSAHTALAFPPASARSALTLSKSPRTARMRDPRSALHSAVRSHSRVTCAARSDHLQILLCALSAMSTVGSRSSSTGGGGSGGLGFASMQAHPQSASSHSQSAPPPRHPPFSSPGGFGGGGGGGSSVGLGASHRQMQSATAAINSAVIEPDELSHAARSILLERQRSDAATMSARKNQQQRERELQQESDAAVSATPPLSPEIRKKKSSASSRRTPQTAAAPAPAAASAPAPAPESLSVFRLTALHELLRSHARRGNFIMLDIDETLMMTKHQPALLLSSLGVRLFQSYVKSMPADFATKNRLCRALEAALKDKVTCEADTAQVVQELQSKGCWVFGVTARYPELAVGTQKTLLNLGIDLTSSAPFPKTVIKDPLTGAVFVGGVIYCGAQAKGTVVSRFLENVVFAQLLQRAQMEAAAEKSRLEAEEAAAAAVAAEFAETDNEQSYSHSHAVRTPGLHKSASAAAVLRAGGGSSSQRYDPTTPARGLRASPSTVSVAESTPSSSNPPSPLSGQSSAASTPRHPDFMTPPASSGPSSNARYAAAYPRVGVSPVPIAHSLRQQHRGSGGQVLSAQGHSLMPDTPATPLGSTVKSLSASSESLMVPNSPRTSAALAMGIAQTSLTRSVSSPAAASLEEIGASSSSASLAAASTSSAYRPARSNAPLFYSGSTRGARARLRRKFANAGDEDEGSGPLHASVSASSLSSAQRTQAFTPSIRRTMSVHGSPVFGPSIPALTPSTISKRARMPPSGSKLTGGNRAMMAAQKRRHRIRVKLRVPRSALPPEVVFIDNDFRNVEEMQTGLKIARKLKIPLKCYCFAPLTAQEIEQQQLEAQQKQLQQQQQEQERLLQQQVSPAFAPLSPVPAAAGAAAAAAAEADQGDSSDSDSAPLQSPHTAAIASALSLASLGSPHHAYAPTSSPGYSRQMSNSSTPLHSQSQSHHSPSQQQAPTGGAGVYGFMIALGNVQPAAAAANHAVEDTLSSTPVAATTPTVPALDTASNQTSPAPVSAAVLLNRRDSTSSLASTGSSLHSPLGRVPIAGASGGGSSNGATAISAQPTPTAASMSASAAAAGEEEEGYEREGDSDPDASEESAESSSSNDDDEEALESDMICAIQRAIKATTAVVAGSAPFAGAAVDLEHHAALAERDAAFLHAKLYDDDHDDTTTAAEEEQEPTQVQEAGEEKSTEDAAPLPLASTDPAASSDLESFSLAATAALRGQSNFSNTDDTDDDAAAASAATDPSIVSTSTDSLTASSSGLSRRGARSSPSDVDGADSSVELQTDPEDRAGTGTGTEPDDTETEHTEAGTEGLSTEYTDETATDVYTDQTSATEADTATENEAGPGERSERRGRERARKQHAAANATSATETPPLRPMLMPAPKPPRVVAVPTTAGAAPSDASTAAAAAVPASAGDAAAMALPPGLSLSPTESLELSMALDGLGEHASVAESLALLQCQMETFAATGVILTNQQALDKVHAKNNPPPEEEESSEEEEEEDEDEEEEDEEEESESEEEEEEESEEESSEEEDTTATAASAQIGQ